MWRKILTKLQFNYSGTSEQGMHWGQYIYIIYKLEGTLLEVPNIYSSYI